MDTNLAQAIAELDRLSDKLQIPVLVKEQAIGFYRKALVRGLVSGKSAAAMTAAALYVACRITEIPRTLKEIDAVSLVKKKRIAQCYRLLVRELHIQVRTLNPVTYISKIAAKASISSQSQGLAAKMLIEAMERLAASRKDPAGLAAAALYLACVENNERKTQKEIAKAAGVTEVTVRNNLKNFKEKQKRVHVATPKHRKKGSLRETSPAFV